MRLRSVPGLDTLSCIPMKETNGIISVSARNTIVSVIVRIKPPLFVRRCLLTKRVDISSLRNDHAWTKCAPIDVVVFVRRFQKNAIMHIIDIALVAQLYSACIVSETPVRNER